MSEPPPGHPGGRLEPAERGAMPPCHYSQQPHPSSWLRPQFHPRTPEPSPPAPGTRSAGPVILPPPPQPPVRENPGGSGFRLVRCLRSIPLDRPLKAVFQVDLGLILKQSSSLLNVGNPQRNVGLVPRHKRDFGPGTGEAHNLHCQVVDGNHASRISNVEGLTHGLVSFETGQESSRHIIHVAPCSNLTAVVVDGDVLTAQRLDDEAVNGSLANLARTIDVERPNRDG